MKYDEYKARSAELVNKFIKLMHKREMNCILTKDREIAETLAGEIRALIDQVLSMQDEVMREDVQAGDIRMLINALVEGLGHAPRNG